MSNSFTSVFGPAGGGTDATKLPLAGGTLTGALAFSASAPQTFLTTVNNFSKINTGIYPSLVLADNVGDYLHLGLSNTGIQMRSGYFLSWSSSATAAGSTADLMLYRAAAASLQLGANHATTATNQTIKAHDVTTGTGADLILKGGTGSVASGKVTMPGDCIITGTLLAYSNSVYCGGFGLAINSSSSLAFGSTTNASGACDAFLSRSAAASLQIGASAASGWISQTLAAGGGRVGTDTNNSPTNTLTIAGSRSTGTGTGGDLRLGVYGTNGTSGTAIGTLNTVLTVVAARKVINIAGIPTSSAGLSSGDVYSNAGILTIVA